MKKMDVLIIVMLLIGSIIILSLRGLSTEGEKYFTIQVGNTEILTELIDDTKTLYNFEFDEHVGVVEVKDGKVRLLEMDLEICPKRICSQTGWIKSKFNSIVCLPNKIIVSIGYKMD